MRKETFISQRIVDRCTLPVEDKRVYLTWCLGEEPQTHKTCFFVVPSAQLTSDCLLGTHCQKGDEENEEQHDDDDERNSEGSQGKTVTNSSLTWTYNCDSSIRDIHRFLTLPSFSERLRRARAATIRPGDARADECRVAISIQTTTVGEWRIQLVKRQPQLTLVWEDQKP